MSLLTCSSDSATQRMWHTTRVLRVILSGRRCTPLLLPRLLLGRSVVRASTSIILFIRGYLRNIIALNCVHCKVGVLFHAENAWLGGDDGLSGYVIILKIAEAY